MPRRPGQTDSVHQSRLRRCLRIMELDPSDENMVQLGVMMEAMAIYQEREAARGGAWKEFGPEDSALHCRSKAVRMAAADPPELALDDGLDIINYGAFFVRNVRGH